jgi:hypothetical protein
MKALAAVLLAACLVRHYSWEWFDTEVQALAWNAAGSVVTMGLLWAFARTRWTREVAAIFAIWGIEEAQVFGCSVGRMFWEWPVLPGQEQCSAPIGIKVGAFTLLGIALFVATCKELHYENSSRGRK